ncbi:MAG: hypothetical protein P8103_16685 [Candidatus Thiodiazotropha sp.]
MAAVTEIFHTGAIPQKTRLQYWSRVANSTFGAMQIESVSSLFTGYMKRRIFRGLELVTVESTPVCVEGLSGSSHHGIFLLLNQRGSSRLQQRGQQTLLKPGELTALYAHEPYLIESAQQHLTHILYLPGKPVEDSLEAHIAVAHPADECELLSAFVRRLAALDGKQPGPGNPLQTARDLVELNWPSSRKRHSRIGTAAWKRAARRWIRRATMRPACSTPSPPNGVTTAASPANSNRKPI